jgi:hypothetical protein
MPITYDYSTIDEDTLKEIAEEFNSKDKLYESIITADNLALFLKNYDSLKNAQAAIDAAGIQLDDESKNIELSKMIADLNEVLNNNNIKQLPDLPPNPLKQELDERMDDLDGGKKSKKYRKSRKGKKYRKSRKTTKRGKKIGSKKSRRR